MAPAVRPTSQAWPSPVGPGPRSGPSSSAPPPQGGRRGLSRPRRWITATVTAALAAGLVAPASGADPEEDKARIESEIDQTKAQVQESTKKLAKATRAYRSAEAALPDAKAAQAAAKSNLSAARAQLASAQAAYAIAAGQLAQAQAAEAEAVRRLVAAEKDVAKGKKAVAKIARNIQSQQTDMGQVAASAYQSGGLGGLESLTLLLDSEDVNEFSSTLTQVQSAMDAQGVVLGDMQDRRAVLANRRVALEEAEARAEAARQQAAAATQAAQEAAAAAAAAEAAAASAQAAAENSLVEAQASTAQVRTLVANRKHAVAAAEDAKAEDEAHFASLQQERERIEAIIAERARQARLAAEREARRAAEAAARAAEEAARSGRSNGGGSAPAPAPAPPAPATSGGFGLPVSAPVTSPYGMRLHPILGYWRLHSGTDFGAGCGVPVHASASGTVVWASWQGGYGNQVLVDHGVVGGRSVSTSYSHLSGFAVGSGARVSRGDVVGYVGTTGYSTGCHLHFEGFVNGATVDPMSLM